MTSEFCDTVLRGVRDAFGGRAESGIPFPLEQVRRSGESRGRRRPNQSRDREGAVILKDRFPFDMNRSRFGTVSDPSMTCGAVKPRVSRHSDGLRPMLAV